MFTGWKRHWGVLILCIFWAMNSGVGGCGGGGGGRITSNASPEYYVLSVAKSGNGQGTVISSPSGITCSQMCNSTSSNFPVRTSITLNAVASPGSIFAGWSGACSGTGDCFVFMDSNHFVTATFSLP